MSKLLKEPNAHADATRERYAVTRELAELPWMQYPGHFNQALSKAIVTNFGRRSSSLGGNIAGRMTLNAIVRKILLLTQAGFTKFEAQVSCKKADVFASGSLSIGNTNPICYVSSDEMQRLRGAQVRTPGHRMRQKGL